MGVTFSKDGNTNLAANQDEPVSSRGGYSSHDDVEVDKLLPI